MKQLYLFCLCLALASSCLAQKNVNDLEWLIGKWNRTNTKPGRTGVETWQKISDTEMIGRGFNLKGTDTVFVEKIKIIVKDHELYYVADVAENKGEVFFKFTHFTRDGFVCENPQHDFPKKIAYSFNGETLKASISGDGKQMDYLFERIP